MWDNAFKILKTLLSTPRGSRKQCLKSEFLTKETSLTWFWLTDILLAVNWISPFLFQEHFVCRTGQRRKTVFLPSKSWVRNISLKLVPFLVYLPLILASWFWLLARHSAGTVGWQTWISPYKPLHVTTWAFSKWHLGSKKRCSKQWRRKLLVS